MFNFSKCGAKPGTLESYSTDGGDPKYIIFKSCFTVENLKKSLHSLFFINKKSYILLH